MLFARLVLLAAAALGATCKSVQKRELIITSELGAPDGNERMIIKVNGQFPGPALIFDEDDKVEITVHNHMERNTTIHWHGMLQIGSQWSDGVPGLTQRPIEPGESFVYRFKASPSGTHWYHSHVRAELMDGLYGAMFVRPKANASTPYHLISNDSTEVAHLKAAALDPEFVILSDWTKFNSSDYLYYENYAQVGIFCLDSYLINGKGWVNCPGPQAILDNALPGLLEAIAPDVPTDKGCFPISPVTQFQFFNMSKPERLPREMFFDCVPTTGSKATITADPGKNGGWVSFNFIGTVASSNLRVSIDEHPMWVYEADGHFIEPRLVHAFDFRAGERYSVLVKLDKTPGDYTLRVPNNGMSQVLWTWGTIRYANAPPTPSRQSVAYIGWYGQDIVPNVVYLDRFDVHPFPPIAVSPTSDVVNKFQIARMNGAWRFSMTSSGVMYPADWRASEPFLQAGPSVPDAFNHSLAVRHNKGQWVDLLLQWHSIVDGASHVMHKHGNKFFVLGTAMGLFEWNSTADAVAAMPEAFNLVNPPYRDTAVAPDYFADESWLLLRYHVETPGPWLFHCHFETHLAEGFAIALLDGVDDWPVVPPEYQLGRNGLRK